MRGAGAGKRLVRQPWRYEWSSVAVHVGEPDRQGVLDLDTKRKEWKPPQWQKALRDADDKEIAGSLKASTSTGRPLASDGIPSKPEHKLGRRLRPLPVGRPKKTIKKQERKKEKYVTIPSYPSCRVVVPSCRTNPKSRIADCRFLFKLFSFFIAVSAGSAIAGDTAASRPDRTSWLHQARWGVFTHYLADTIGLYDSLPANQRERLLVSEEIEAELSKLKCRMTVKRWNAYVDSFDVKALARQLKQCGAGYFVITIGQNSGYYCAPNATYDRLVGILPSKCSKRDLISDLYEVLEPQGIKLMVYLPAGAPDRDAQACKKLAWKSGPRRNREFQLKWEQVIADWSKRWGSKVKGWWFDGCYWPNEMYRHPEPPNFQSFAAAALAGNPDAIITFNPGVKRDAATNREFVAAYTEFEDYTAGEICKAQQAACPGRWISGEQWHMLSYIGRYWYWSKLPRFTDQEVIDITRRITDRGGVVTWDVMIQPDGKIAEPMFKSLLAVGRAMGTVSGAK
jgi:hypothetical protein